MDQDELLQMLGIDLNGSDSSKSLYYLPERSQHHVVHDNQAIFLIDYRVTQFSSGQIAVAANWPTGETKIIRKFDTKEGAQTHLNQYIKKAAEIKEQCRARGLEIIDQYYEY